MPPEHQRARRARMGAAVQLQSAVERFVAAPVRKMLIDGKLVEAASGKTFETSDPPPPGVASCTRRRRDRGGGGGQTTRWTSPLLMGPGRLARAPAGATPCAPRRAEQPPLTAPRRGELRPGAGVPAGVVNIVPGF